jgi:tetratricopeptide (TPR) repeat protein
MGRLPGVICAVLCVTLWLGSYRAYADDLGPLPEAAPLNYSPLNQEELSQDTAPATSIPEEQPAAVQTAPPDISGTSLMKVEAKWKEVLAALKLSPLKDVGDRLDELNDLRVELDVSGLEVYSFNLLGRASAALKKNDIPAAAFFSKKALQLSPQSPRLLWNSIGVATESGVSSVGDHFFRALGATVRSPQVMLHLLKGATYPGLWALTLALLLLLALSLVWNAPTLLVAAGKHISTQFRGIGAPILATLALTSPLFFGPLWTIFAWSLVVAIWLPRSRWLSFYGGALIALWGVVIPLRENLNHWLDDPRVGTMLNAASGIFSSSDRSDLTALIRQHPDDGVALFMLGQVLRRYEQYDQAQIAIQRAEGLLGEQPWTKAEQGLIAFLTGKVDQADKLFLEAEELGLSSAEFYFDYSRIKFEQVDVAKSREYLALANHKSAGVTAMLREREDRFGMKSNRSIAEIRLPLRTILTSGLKPAERDKSKFDLVAQSIMPATNPIILVVIGAALMLTAFPRRERRGPSRKVATYIGYKPGKVIRLLTCAIPGCSQVMSGRIGRGLLLLASLVFVLMPLVDWPRESGMVLELLPGFQWYYTLAAFLVIGSAVTVQVLASKES